MKDADLRDVFRGIAHEYEINLFIDNRIDKRITTRLSNIPIFDALAFLCQQNGLVLSQDGTIFRVDLPKQPPPEPVPPPDISIQDSLLSVNLTDEPLTRVISALGTASSRNFVIRKGLTGTVTATLRDVPLDVGIRTLLTNNGFSIRELDGIYHVGRFGMADSENATNAFWIQVSDSLVTLDVTNAHVSDVLREIASQLSLNLITYQVPENTITAKVKDLTFDDTLNYLFRGTNVTYRKEHNVYFVGSKETNGIATTRLLKLNHIRADAVMESIPEALKSAAIIQVIREHNGLMVTGTNDVIVELEDVIKELDHPTPQILIEALVVDFKASDMFDLGIEMGRDAEKAAGYAADGFDIALGGEGDQGYNLRGGSKKGNRYVDGLNSVMGLLGLHKIGRLPDDFYFKIHALSVEGRVEIRSRPQIATLNGHTASLSIGTTQYFILKSNTPYTSPSQVYVQESERFEKIEANVKLEITPWVSSSGEVTAEIRPEFSAPVGEFDPQVPPTINSRVLDSTVRLRDGETIILGGLIQDTEDITFHKVPVLGSIPLLGRLFRGESKDNKKSELVIFLTPHVFYGDERDDERWQQLEDKMDLESKGRKTGIGYTEFE